eukprot:1462826-Pyramimonas_sp.AAC.1
MQMQCQTMLRNAKQCKAMSSNIMQRNVVQVSANKFDEMSRCQAMPSHASNTKQRFLASLLTSDTFT